MKYIIGTKQNMTQIFNEEGVVFPVTIIKAGPVVVTQIKTEEKDGYKAVQVGFGSKHEKNVSKAVKGHTKGQTFALLREYELEDGIEVSVGDVIDLSVFEKGEKIRTSSISKGKGFQGVVKRHGFKGGRGSHGNKHAEREPGSIGNGGVQRVFKGTRMGGRMGTDRVTEPHTIIDILPETGEILVSGSVPGRRGTIVEISG